MEVKSFKVNIFDVSIDEDGPPGQIPFLRAIERACDCAFDRRGRYVNLKERRLEHDNRLDGCYLLNFITFNYPGPGRVRDGAPAAPIGLDAEEYFSHETAMLYDPDEHLAFIEAGRGGMGSGAIARYMAEFATAASVYQMVPRLDPYAAARARRFRQFRKVEMRVACGPAGSVDRHLGVGAIEAFGEEYGARHVDVVLTVGRERWQGLMLNSVRRLFGLQSDNDDHDDGIEKLKVYGRENEDDPLEVIDLIQHRETRERPLPVDANSRQINHFTRWHALGEIRQDFLRDVLLG